MHLLLKTLLACLILASSLGWIGCQSNLNNSTPYSVKAVDGIFVDSLSNQQDSGKAICIYDRAALRRLPTKKRYPDGEDNFITTIWYGETVESLNEMLEVEKEKVKFIRVRLGDGNEGWVFEYAFETDAKRGAMIKPSPLYRRPDLMTLRNDTLKAGEIVAVIERQGDWLHVSGRNKDKKGWIQVGNNVSLREKDVYIALLWYKARTSKRRLRPGKVANVLHDPAIAGSLLKDLVETDYNQNYKALLETEEADVPSEDESDPSPVDSVSASATSGAEQLLITDQNVRVHSSPDSQTDNIVTELEEGTVCVVLARGQRAEVAETEDYWYKVDHQGQEGWVFGHYTSKRVLR
ncbi:MAG: SH3 domain-containing protein [Bacteroidota bacterium]